MKNKKGYARRKGDTKLPFYEPDTENRDAGNYLFRISKVIKAQFHEECKKNKQSMSRALESQMVSYIINSKTFRAEPDTDLGE